MNLPIISLEVEGMRHNIKVALAEHQVKMDKMVNDAIDRATEPERIKEVIDHEVHSTIDKVVKEEVNNFFKYSGEGRKIIAKLVKEKLMNKDTYTPLDDV